MVLIVAKCIVNSFIVSHSFSFTIVLIVAKCIVNSDIISGEQKNNNVLIVAKCIVNKNMICKTGLYLSINSSKVYCKYV